MKCYYEVLEVERTVDLDAIKKAYRKLALQWHPDKNPDRIEQATREFSLIQQAYEVLSDPNERAWYDRHRNRILRTCSDNDVDDGFDLFPFFCSSCYTGFGDDDEGFYAVYRRVFESVATEESIHNCDITYPSFGDSKSDYEQVVSIFYDFWLYFSTQRPFSWLNKFDIRQAENRYVLKLMEKENIKLRAEGKRKRNEEIQALVAFVRKRDKRVAEYNIIIEQKKAEQLKKAVENKEQAIRNHLSRIGEYKESEEIRQEHLNNLLEIEETLVAEFGEVNLLEGDSEEEDSNLYCIVCEKAFKSSRAFSNHQKSKKHKDAVERLKIHLKDDDLEYFNEVMVDDSVNNAEAVPQSSKSKNKKKARRKKDNLDVEFDDEKATINGPEHMEVENKDDKECNDVKNSNFSGESGMKLQKSGKKTKAQSAVESETDEGVTSKIGICDKCGELFDSRTKLFKHLRETNHATIKVCANDTAQRRKKRK